MEKILNIEAIQKVLPHRFPFLLVDRVLEMETDKRVVGIKNVTINEDFFNGHFPGKPVMPGVLMVEAMAQLAGVLMLSKPENSGKIAYFVSIDKARFRGVVVPGDQLRLEVNILKLKGKFALVQGNAYVEKNLVAEAEMMFAYAD